MLAALALRAALASAVAVEPGIRIDGCAEERASDIEAAWRLELQRKAFLDSSARPVSVSLECHATKIRIQVSTADGARSLSREIDVSSVPDTAQGRLVAIAAAELSTPLRRGEPDAEGANRSAGDAAMKATTSSAPAVSVASRPPVAPPAPPASGAFAVFADARGFVSGDTPWLAGAGARLEKRWENGWAVGTDAVFGTASQALTLGHERTMLASARPLFTRALERGRVRLAFGAGARLTFVRLAGEPNQTGVDGATLWGFEVGPALTVSGALRIARATSLSLLLEGGRAIGQTIGREAGAAAITIGGAWVGAQLGVELSR